MSRHAVPFVPKRGSVLKVVAVCRISTVHQDPRSLADQEAYYRRWLENNVSIPWTMEVIASQGSGENLEREEYLSLVERSGEFDLVLIEDLGRICRRVQAHVFCENAVDQQTRVIAINDHLDTGAEGWELSSYFAVMRHESYNKDTSKRIRRSLRNRFAQGGVVQCLPFGYVKPHAHATDTDCTKAPDAELIYQEWFQRLEQGQFYAEIADWLNEKQVPVGPYARSPRWTSGLVAKVTHNPILKGERRRNERMSIRINATGKRRSVKAPATELLARQCPHLAFFDAAYYDGVIAMLQLRNDKYRRGRGGEDCRRNVPRSRTRWPGQHLRCGICGRQYVFGGHGQTHHLMCDGARQHRCWNGVTCDGPLLVKQVLGAILNFVERLEGFDETFRAHVIAEAQAGLIGLASELKELERREQSLQNSIANFAAAIGQHGPSETLLTALRDSETALADIRLRIRDLKRRQVAELPVVPTAEELRELARSALADIDVSTPDFARLMRELIPTIHVFPYRLIDGGLPVLRAQLILNLLGLVPASGRLPGPMAAFQSELVVDVFEKPVRERIRPDVVAGIRLPGMTYRKLAEQLRTHMATTQRAAQLQRLMDSAGVTDPYLPIRTPIEGNNKYSRHRHPRFDFEPLPGYEQPIFPQTPAE